MQFKFIPLDIFRNSDYICSESYLDGDKMIAYGPFSLFEPTILYNGNMKLMIGIRYANVLPSPVGAMAIRSLFSKPIVIACI